MKGYEHVIWDWNGTLLDDVGLCVDVMNRMLRARGMAALDAAYYRQIFAFPVKKYYQILGFDLVAEPFERLAAEYCMEYDARVTECTLHAEAIDALNLFSSQGVGQSILSSHEHETLLKALRSFEVDGYFEEVVGLSDRYAAGKIEAGHELISRLGIDPADTVLVGDTEHDHEVAAALGSKCILVANGHHSNRRLRAVHDDVIESLVALASRAA